MIEIKGIPYPPTMNHRYIPKGGRLILSPEYRKYKQEMLFFTANKCRNINAEHLKEKKLSVEIDYLGPWETWFTKSNRIRKTDADNRHKSILDFLFPFIGLDDSQIFDFKIRKLVGSNQTISVNLRIEEIKD